MAGSSSSALIPRTGHPHPSTSFTTTSAAAETKLAAPNATLDAQSSAAVDAITKVVEDYLARKEFAVGPGMQAAISGRGRTN
jgi:hypothetical protein